MFVFSNRTLTEKLLCHPLQQDKSYPDGLFCLILKHTNCEEVGFPAPLIAPAMHLHLRCNIHDSLEMMII